MDVQRRGSGDDRAVRDRHAEVDSPVRALLVVVVGRQNPNCARGLALLLEARASSTVAFSLLYIGLSRIVGLVVSCRRTESDKDIEIMVLRHQVSVLERQLHARVRY